MKRTLRWILISALILILAGCEVKEDNITVRDLDVSVSSSEEVKDKEIEEKIEEVEDERDDVEITLGVTGDIMYHPWTFYRNVDSQGNYDFSFFYEKVKKLTEEFDLMAGNYETTSTPNRNMEGYPLFNTPSNSIEQLKESGFDILTTANNHCLDSGAEGISDTIDALDTHGIHTTGTFKDDNRQYLIVEEQGIKIGILAYSQMFNGMEGVLAQEQRDMINPMTEDLMKNDVKSLKENVDFLIVFPHWGEEYSFNPTEFQRNMGKNLLNWGADIVMGSHPHVIQPIEEVDFDGEKKFIFYSMGNSISGQRQEYNGLKEVEAGLIAGLKLKKSFKENKTTLEQVDIHPTWVMIDKTDGKTKAKVTLIEDYKEGGELYNLVSPDVRNRVLGIGNRSIEILESMGYVTGLKGNI